MAERRWTMDEMRLLATRGAMKVDARGMRGVTLCSAEEIAAMAAVLLLSGAVTIDKTSEGNG